MLAQSLIALSATIMLMLGALHLYATYFGSDLRPQDPELEARMKHVAPGVTSDTTMWKGWIAFNTTQSLGLMLFGVLYGYLAIFQFSVLLQATTLLLVGALFLLSMLVVATRFMFRIPVVAFGLCLVLYALGTIIAMMAT